VREIRDLIDDHPHTITIESSDPRAISRYFYDDPATMSTEFCESSVTIRTRDPNRCYQRINDVVLDEGVAIHSIRCADDNLQSVFEYLIK
jgi:ABC-2 type transport system ATP-binding protein